MGSQSMLVALSSAREDLVRERHDQLQEIARVRETLLKEFYIFVKHREDLGHLIEVDEAEGVDKFLDRYRLPSTLESFQLNDVPPILPPPPPHPPERQYVLPNNAPENVPPPSPPPPPLPYDVPEALPAFMNRKSNPSKANRKRKDPIPRDTFVPMEAARWAAVIRANPVHTHVRKATKCLTTNEWNIAIRELRLLRAIEAIDRLKADGRWSFRQPKKQKGPILPKTHQDYLLDEMQWMQIDFREERKWKLAVAHELALAAKDWHEADEEGKRELCVGWKQPDINEMDEDAEDAMEVVREVGVPDRSEDEDEDPEEEAADETFGGMKEEDIEVQIGQNLLQKGHALSQEPTLAEALEDGATIAASAQDQPPPPLPLPARTPGPDLVPTSTTETGESADAMVVDAPATVTVVEEVSGEQPPSSSAPTAMDVDVKTEDVEKPSDALGLKDSSSDPILPQPPSSPMLKAKRAPILSLPPSATSLPSPFDDMTSLSDTLTTLFPDYTLYTPLPDPLPDPALLYAKKEKGAAQPLHTGRRIDETLQSRVYGVSHFMEKKPVLVSALAPSKNWRNGTWTGLDETVVLPDEGASKDRETASLFVSPSAPARKLTAMGFNYPHPSLPRPHARVKHSPSPWSPAEDELLKFIVERYAYNWSLIADAYNSDRRIRMQSESRTPWECQERWISQFASDIPPGRKGSVGVAGVGEETSGSNVAEESLTPRPDRAQEKEPTGMATRGLKRRAASMNMPPPNTIPNSGPANESRKRKRHTYVIEAIRKTVKKREAHQKASAQKRSQASATPHETHNIVSKVKLTPAELSRLKQEQDAEIAKRRAELVRQQHAQRFMVQNPLMRGNMPMGGGLPPPGPGGIRPGPGNISQQQRMPPNIARPAVVDPTQQRQLLQAITAQRAAQAQAQAQAQANGQAAPNGQAQPPVPGQAVPMPAAVALANGGSPHLLPAQAAMLVARTGTPSSAQNPIAGPSHVNGVNGAPNGQGQGSRPSSRSSMPQPPGGMVDPNNIPPGVGVAMNGMVPPAGMIPGGAVAMMPGGAGQMMRNTFMNYHVNGPGGMEQALRLHNQRMHQQQQQQHLAQQQQQQQQQLAQPPAPQ
ncbi:hypothetical protein SISNIDRAFT_548582 [Sistotremastrum niveocremeum HHB9708]|uniref:Vacuolar import and degradation protein 21 n=1 Tax=Sistotremastrum niveocremeum HHB9708 TaxID=1314777 RepID=A0A164WNK4_9AGAM|nr:hypothetical protein SISNIDRAFT_548582 [Sistotremastrum niveocremeum HHB9708]